MIYLIILFAGIFRFVSLNQSLWLDEATTASVSRMSIGDIFTKFLPGDFHPPLYYVFMKYWVSLFGMSEISLRIPSIIFGLATVYLTYLIAKKILDNKTALIAALFIATSGLSIYYSQEARMYSMTAFLVTFAFWLFLNEKWKQFSAILALIVLTDYVALFTVPVFFYLGFKNKKFKFAVIPSLFAFLVWLPVFYKQINGGLAVKSSSPEWWNLIGTTSFKNIALVPVKFILGRITIDDKVLYALMALLVLTLFGYPLYKAIKSPNSLWLWLLAPLAISVIVSFKIPTLSYFRFLFCLPAFYILVAKGAAKSRLLVLAILFVNLLSSLYYLASPRFWREDWRRAAAVIGEDTIIYPSDSQKETLIYYGRGGQILYYKNFRAGPRTVWLSRYLADVFDPEDLARKKVESLGYNNAVTYDFNGVIFYKYEYNPKVTQ